ncbi:App1 family protein [Aquimarina sp. 2201CG5-10]|uniref:App1 family protein n=1 Tax=Aquimarina callyspongiae TaxID=3098150 RepID=UPI002AB36C07|nr:phosphatase domain-containing protein [Aquimarina sp. 2201CG5-10]MDY8136589.1 phosphatase domain-containing protein [Aquimarina sp. 2201CG5-10]
MFRKKPLRINSYLGYGTLSTIRAVGRALEDENVQFNGNTGTLKTLKNIYRQFESDEIPNILIELKLSNGETFSTYTDAEGYYLFQENIHNNKELINAQGWIYYTVSFKEKQHKSIINNNIFEGEMLVPSSQAEYGIISDIDDTILHTGVASLFKWKVAVNTFFKNFDKRLPIEGTIDLYRKLQSGKQNSSVNPVFYVSNSPWNLYDYLVAFLKKHNFPKGPILLRDFRTPFDKTPKPTLPHKYSEILNILKTYPDLKFILIGDSGEKDADTYTKISNEHPGRILAIYLRNVKHPRKEKRIKKIINKFKTAPILLVNTSEEAIEHAKMSGFIS